LASLLPLSYIPAPVYYFLNWKNNYKKISSVLHTVLGIFICSGRIMKALENVGVPVPTVLDFCDDSR
jgi:hypothetical protein